MITDLLRTFEDETSVKVTPDLKFVEKDAGGVSLKGVLQRARAKHLREKTPWRIGKTFSPSQITYNYCRRIKVAQLADKTELFYDKHPPRVQNKFDIGNALHDIVKQWFWDVGLLQGDFYCSWCDITWFDISPRECSECRKRRYLEFKEASLINEEYQLKGRADLVVAIDGEPVVDIKSISGRTASTPAQQLCFEDLDERGPKNDHIVQINFYLFMMEKENGHLLYINKNDGRIKTFAVPYDKEILKPYLEEITHLLELAEKWKAGELKPEELPVPCGRKDCPCDELVVSSKHD